MKRHEHLFQFKADQISKAAAVEWVYHDDRCFYWTEEREKTLAKIKLAGIEIREYPVTGGKNVSVGVDVELTNYLQMCINKIASHQKAADDFRILSAVYETQGTRTYELQPDDVIFFRLAGGEREE